MVEDLTLPIVIGTEIEAASTTSATPVTFTPTKKSVQKDNSFYNWYAATAESDLSTSGNVGIDAPASICPVGWRLPSRYTVNNAKSYGGLVTSYTGTSSSIDTHTNSNNVNYGNWTATHELSYLQPFPISLNRSGYYVFWSDGVWHHWNAGYYGFYWSATSIGDNNISRNDADRLGLFASSLEWPPYGGKDSSEFSINVRCVSI